MDDSDIEFTDSDEGEEEEAYDPINADAAANGAGNGALPLLGMVPGFLEHAAGMQPLWRMRRPSDSNDALVEQLTREGTITMKEIREAMKICPRDQFVPGGKVAHPDVFADSPLRLNNLGWNVSAPHIHASCLQAMDLQPGHRVLDVGCGSGLLSAYAARIVCKRGSVVGIDIKSAAVKLSQDNLARQISSNSAFALHAAPCEFHTHNVFMPGNPFKADFDRIVVGASAPPSQLKRLLGLLKEEGGVIVTPVIPSDLQKITKRADGTVGVSLLSKVRFSDLEVPKDGEIIQAFMDAERTAFLQPPLPNSTFASDVASITGCSSASLPGSSIGSGQSHFPADSPSPSANWALRGAAFLAACGSRSTYSSCDMDAEDGGPSPTPTPTSARLDIEELGPCDCELAGSNWTLPAHMCVLRARCGLFRAQSESGMRDALATRIKVPEEFPQGAVSAFLEFCATDQLDEGITPGELELILGVAHFYGNDHLVQLCEFALVRHLREQACTWEGLDDDGAPETAASLLALAEENGLPHLLACCLDLIVRHYPAVAKTKAYGELSKEQTDLIAAHACSQISLYNTAIREVA